MKRIYPLFLVFSLSLYTCADEMIWLKAEDAQESNLSIDGKFRPLDADQKALFSGGAWTVSFSRRAASAPMEKPVPGRNWA